MDFYSVYPIVNKERADVGNDGFGMKLQTMNGEDRVIKGHDMSLFIDSADFKRRREGRRGYRPRVIAPDNSLGRKITINRIFGILND